MIGFSLAMTAAIADVGVIDVLFRSRLFLATTLVAFAVSPQSGCFLTFFTVVCNLAPTNKHPDQLNTPFF